MLNRHGRAEERLRARWPGYPRLFLRKMCTLKTWMPATSADMTGMRPDEAARTLPFVAKMLRTVVPPMRRLNVDASGT
jgi:hypothetical protein